MTAQKKLKITLIASKFGRNPKHGACIRGLGLRRINHQIEVIDTPCIRGMINKIAYLVKVEDVV